MAEEEVFSLSQVLNVTKFLQEHPGGDEVLIDSAGKDATKEFEEIVHSKAAQKLLLRYQVGVLRGYTFTEAEIKDAASSQEPKKTEMEAFVIKDDRMPKHAALHEFFVPFLVAGSYFAYRCLTRPNEILH